MEKNDNKSPLNELKHSPLFAISLASKELAHSNFWKWLLDIKDSEGRHPFIKVFKPDFYERGKECTFLKVEREKFNFDLYITYKDEKGRSRSLVVENKIKAIADKSQLIRYQNKRTHSFEFDEGILTGLIENKSIGIGEGNLTGWTFLSYADIADNIKSILEENLDSEYGIFISQYVKDLNNIQFLIDEAFKRKDNKDKYVYFDKHLSNIRFSDVFLKLKATEFANRIKDEIDNHVCDLNLDMQGWSGPYGDVSFSNGTQIITFVYREMKPDIKEYEKYNLNTKSEYGRIGVQIQRDQFRIYGGSSSSERKNSERTFDKLVDVGYLCSTISAFKVKLNKENEENKKNKEDKKNKESGTKMEKYCSYGNHLYQYWNIPDQSYDYLINETIKQLKIAKGCIEKGLSFKE